MLKSRGNLFVITNDADRHYFPVSWKNRIFAFYGGVNINQILSVEKEGGGAQKYDLVFCSRLCTQKGILPFLDIWKRVVETLPHARFGIIGNGRADFERRLRAKAEILGISETIEWLGYVNNEDKYRVYRASRLFVHPTIYDNNGMVAAEALCTGLPVVMNNLESLKDVYTTGCAKSDFSNTQATADLIIRLLSDDTFYNP